MGGSNSKAQNDCLEKVTGSQKKYKNDNKNVSKDKITTIDRQSQSPISKLNPDCLDEIFDYLTMDDLYSFGRTCKLMQKIAGNYFKLNYLAATTYSTDREMFTVYSDKDGIIRHHIETSTFMPFITYLVLGSRGEYISNYTEESQPLNYIKFHCDEFDSINRLYFVCVNLMQEPLECIEPILKNIEILRLRGCNLTGDLYKCLLKFCGNLRQLALQEHIGNFGHSKNENNWLLRKYPKLEHFEIIQRYSIDIGDIGGFFKRNPHIRSFTIDSRNFMLFKDILMKFMPKLDRLEIRDFRNDKAPKFKDLCSVLNEFYERDRFKKLHIFIDQMDQSGSEQLTSLLSLESLYIRFFEKGYNLPLLSNLKELAIFQEVNFNDMEHLANGLVNLEQLFLSDATVNDILPFIKQSIKLKKIKLLLKDEECDGNTLKLEMLNDERQKVFGAQKVMIFVSNTVFLATKLTTTNGDLNLNYVEVRRSDSYNWKSFH